VTKVSTVETIAIEEFFAPGKRLSSLRKSISSRLMTSFSSEHIASFSTDSDLASFTLLDLGG
jgi:hypothetical protein